MKLFGSRRLIACLAIGFSCISINAVTTVPVGAVQLTISSGNVPIAPAFIHPNSFQGAVTGASLTGEELTVTVADNSFVAGDFNEGTFPFYYVEVISPGDYQGMVFDVISNTANELVILTWPETPQPIAADDVIALRKHMTVGDFFSDAEDTLGVFADSIKIFYDTGVVTSLWMGAGSGWSGGDNMPIYPGQGLLTLFSSPQSFVVYGTVKSTPTQVPVRNGDINLVGSMTPVDTTLSEMDVLSWMGLYTDSFKTFADDGTLASTGTFLNGGGFLLPNDADILGHSAFLLLPATDMNWVQPAAYTE